VIGAYIAAAVVTLVQYLRLRERRLLLLAALFAFQVQALSREWWDGWKHVYEGAVCVAGLALLLAMTLRHPAAAKPTVAHPPAAERRAPAVD
jgi:hypothetical protein